jgi:hypothetical protein
MPIDVAIVYISLVALVAWFWGYATGYKKVQRAWLASKDYETMRDKIV